MVASKCSHSQELTQKTMLDLTMQRKKGSISMEEERQWT